MRKGRGHTLAARPSSLFANTLELRSHLSRLEPFEALHFFAPLGLLRFFALSPPLARCLAAFRMLCRPAHALYGTWEGWDVRRIGFFEPEVVRAFETLGDLVKHLLVFGKFAVGVGINISPGRCRWGIWVFGGCGPHGDILVGRYAPR
jgi:hypothetical protein